MFFSEETLDDTGARLVKYSRRWLLQEADVSKSICTDSHIITYFIIMQIYICAKSPGGRACGEDTFF
jgi:hypothetical protein